MLNFHNREYILLHTNEHPVRSNVVYRGGTDKSMGKIHPEAQNLDTCLILKEEQDH
jgi:hypothetical protein